MVVVKNSREKKNTFFIIQPMLVQIYGYVDYAMLMKCKVLEQLYANMDIDFKQIQK